MISPPQILPDAGETTVDHNVAGPIGLAAGDGQAYLVYQLATGEVYATTTDSGAFPARLSLVSGQGGLPPAAVAFGPGIAFDTAGQRVLVGYQSADFATLVVASSDPTLATGWSLDALIPLGAPVEAGTPMVAGSFGGISMTILFAVLSGSPRKVVYATSQDGWSGGLQSVILNDQPFNPPDCAGLAPSMRDPDAAQIALAYTVGTQASIALSEGDAPGIFSIVENLPALMTTNYGPGLMIDPDKGAWWALTNTNQTVYYAWYFNGWSEPTPLTGLPSNMGGAPAGVWNGLTAYVACVGLDGTLSCMTFRFI